MIVIDATDLILGRLATYAAKQALLGEEVIIINAQKAIISGKRSMVLAKVRQDMDRGTPAKGPFIPKKADRYVRRVIRGMLPYKQPKGAEAFKRVMCYIDVPEELKDKKIVQLDNAKAEKLPTLNYITVDEAVRYA